MHSQWRMFDTEILVSSAWYVTITGAVNKLKKFSAFFVHEKG